MHGDGNLDKAISLLENEDKKDFWISLILKFHSIHIICLFANHQLS